LCSLTLPVFAETTAGGVTVIPDDPETVKFKDAEWAKIRVTERENLKRNSYPENDARYEGSESGYCSPEGHPVPSLHIDYSTDHLCLDPKTVKFFNDNGSYFRAPHRRIGMGGGVRPENENNGITQQLIEQLGQRNAVQGIEPNKSEKKALPNSSSNTIKYAEMKKAIKAFDADLNLELVVGYSDGCSKEKFTELYKLGMGNFYARRSSYENQKKLSVFEDLPNRRNEYDPCQIYLIIDVPKNYKIPTHDYALAKKKAKSSEPKTSPTKIKRSPR